MPAKSANRFEVKEMEEKKNELLVHASAIAEILKEIGNPHLKIEISINEIAQTSVDWSEPTPEWD